MGSKKSRRLFGVTVWVELLITHDILEAEMIKDILESGGIPVIVRSSKVSPYPVNIGKIGEIRVLVREDDREDAEAAIGIRGAEGHGRHGGPAISDKKIDVVAHAGHRGEETPRAFILDGERIEVIEILDMWIEEGIEDRARKRFFKVKGDDGYIHLIYHDEETAGWFYNRIP